MISWLIVAFLGSTTRADQGRTVIPSENLNLNEVNFTGQAAGGGGGFNVTALVSCFGTNLRNVPNPLNPNSDVIMTLNLRRRDGQVGKVAVTFPASVVKAGGTAAFTAFASGSTLIVTPSGLDTGLNGGFRGQTILLSFGYSAPIGVKAFELQSVDFTQQVKGPDPYYAAYDGPVARSLSFNYSGDKSTLYIEASFPGAAGFCGGYYSPLMMFFSDKRPELLKDTTFKLRLGAYSFYWPEGSPDWAFLVMDRNQNGKVDSGEELFGDSDRVNGFEALRILDSNKDGKINAKDKAFSKLRLWFDMNGNGKTDGRELRPLSSKKVEEISLDYDGSRAVPLATRGELRESSKVKLSDGEAELIDVWLSVHQEVKPRGSK